MTPLYLVVGGALGTLARYYLTTAAGRFVGVTGVGVFVVNIAGSFLIGLLLTLGTERYGWAPETRALVAAGFLGAFTTFSTLTWETWRLADGGNVAGAALNIAGSVACGIAAVYAGVQLARAV